MKLVFFGTSAFGVPSLEAIVRAGHEVAWVATQPDRPQGRGLRAQPSPIKEAAHRLGLAVGEPATMRDALAECERIKPEAGIVIAYGRLIPPALLSLPPHGMLGVHPSLLPKWRGASPMVWPVLHGDAETGVTIFRLNERMDAGPIFDAARVAIGPRDTAETLARTLAALGAERLVAVLAAIASGTARAQPQDESQATATTKLTKEHGRVDWTQPAAAIDRQIRAMQPWPGAYTTLRGKLVKLWSASPTSGRGAPGRVISADASGILVAAGDGVLRIDELQLEGKRRMTAGEFLQGHPIKSGEVFGG